MLLKDGTDTTEYERPGRYCDQMAIVLDSLYMQGDDGDAMVEVGNGAGYIRYGRRILSWSYTGFLSSSRFDTVEEAESFMNDLDENDMS